MEYPINDNMQPISFDVPIVSFPGYEAYKEKAIDVASQIQAMEVDPENIKEAKTTLAEARKITDRLSRVRIDVKKEILRNYQIFEEQVKEIASIIGDADDALRAKVRELEEAERKAKKEMLRITWNSRIERYPFVADSIKDPFDKWLKPQHLNKSTSMKKVETDMVEWLEKTDNDLQAADAMGDEYLVEYIRTGNLTTAIQNVKDRELIHQVVTSVMQEGLEEATAWFLIRGTKDIKLVEMLLKENEIKFERK